ncbi:hypothetical protein SAMN05192551_1106 [Tindallia magadiensis]|uniref:Uncharacterized protein n=1 Tax=Tindallia magadiensis TaxID=69895 RepID=A0A1I3GQ54_9FIRM|nr:hypothetical protein SAMN05192551_1106 [Tindallia magadiensis]
MLRLEPEQLSFHFVSYNKIPEERGTNEIN